MSQDGRPTAANQILMSAPLCRWFLDLYVPVALCSPLASPKHQRLLLCLMALHTLIRGHILSHDSISLMICAPIKVAGRLSENLSLQVLVIEAGNDDTTNPAVPCGV
jgi:hypothetical protein